MYDIRRNEVKGREADAMIPWLSSDPYHNFEPRQAYYSLLAFVLWNSVLVKWHLFFFFSHLQYSDSWRSDWMGHQRTHSFSPYYTLVWILQIAFKLSRGNIYFCFSFCLTLYLITLDRTKHSEEWWPFQKYSLKIICTYTWGINQFSSAETCGSGWTGY